MRKLTLLILCLLSLAAMAQTVADSPRPGNQPAAQPVLRYHFGDDPRWADANFDDSSWPVARDGWFPLPPFYSDGFIWVRAHVPAPLGILGPLAVRQINPGSVPDAEELYVNGTLAGQNGRVPPRTVAEVTMIKTVFPLPPGLAQPGSTAVVALRGWVQPFNRGSGKTGSVIFNIDRLQVLAAAAQNQQLMALMRQMPILIPEGLLFLLGVGLLFMWRWTGRIELALFGAILITAPGFVLLMALTGRSGFLPLPMRLWVWLWAPSQVLSPAFNVELAWVVLALPGRFWKRTAIASLGLFIACDFVAHWAYQPSLLVALCMRMSDPWINLMGVILITALVWHLIFRRTNRLLAIAFGVPALTSILGTTIGLPHVNLRFVSASYLTLALLVSSIAIACVLVGRAWKSWREGNDLRVEMEAAREVQRRLVPATLPAVAGYALDAAYLPAAEVGGDFYQVIAQGDGSILVVVGDVSGKGLKAAMTGTLAIGALRTLASEGLSPAALLARLNREMVSAQDGGFITCLCARIARDGGVVIANAGHLAPYWKGEEVEVENGLPLGLAPDADYTETTLRLTHGESLTLLSDGVVEARNAGGELFGFERTRTISGDAAGAIAATAQRFGQEDDITVVRLTLTEGLHG